MSRDGSRRGPRGGGDSGSRNKERKCHRIEKCHTIRTAMSRNQNGNVTQSIRKMSQRWMEFLAGFHDIHMKE